MSPQVSVERMSQMNAWNKLPGTDADGWHIAVGSFCSGKHLGEDETHLLWGLLAPWGPQLPKISSKFNSPFHSPPSLSSTTLSHLNSVFTLPPNHNCHDHSPLWNPSTRKEARCKPRIIILPLPMPLCFLCCLLWYLLAFEAVLCGAGTTPYIYLQRRLW